MRIGSLRGLNRAALRALWLPAVLLAASVHAEPAAVAPAIAAAVHVRIEPPDALPSGAHAVIVVHVELPAGTPAPVVLTPSVEGAAVEVVRGRLSRADAKSDDTRHLRFELPVIARAQGTAVLRVEVATYVCTPRCRSTVVAASHPLRVSPR